MLPDRESLQKPEVNSERVQRFEAIWEKTKGTDFEKTLAMLQAYCDIGNWGTHSKSVWSVVKKYLGGILDNGYCKSVKSKDVLLFTVEFLLLQLSEKISFNTINPKGDLAAIFHVIFTHTNINAYDFAQGTELYRAFEEHKDEMKRGVMEKSSWTMLAKQIDQCWHDSSANPSLVSALMKVKLIDYVDAWEIIVRSFMLTHTVGKYDQHFTIADEDFLPLLGTEKVKLRRDFILYLYLKKYNLSLDRERYFYSGLSWMNVIHVLCDLTVEKNDGAIILAVIGFMQEEKRDDKQLYDMLIKLIEKRHLFENWNEIEKVLIDNNTINFVGFLCHAIEKLSVSAIRYLLEEKKVNVDIKFIHEWLAGTYYYKAEVAKTPIQKLIAFVSSHYDIHGCFEAFLDILKILVRHDPDCVYIKDKSGNDIFHYWEYTSKLWRNCFIWHAENVRANVSSVINEADSIIRNAFHRKRAFTFFQGKNKKDGANNISMLPNDVLGIICAHTMYSEISARESSGLISPENRVTRI
jgi:hypothetical protein